MCIEEVSSLKLQTVWFIEKMALSTGWEDGDVGCLLQMFNTLD